MYVALDAGHGIDTYPPDKGVPTMPEFEFNSRVVELAKPMIEGLGHKVLLTQPLNGTDVPLHQRTSKANREGVDILLSFHADANTNTNARGHWAFYWHTSTQGKRLADIWSNALSETTGTRHRGNQPSRRGHWTNFHMVRETNMPAVLMEHGFMTNPQDLKLLKSESFRHLCAEAAALAVHRYAGYDITLTDLRKGSNGKKREDRFMKPTSDALYKDFKERLERAEKRGIINKKWVEQYKDGTLEQSDAIALTMLILSQEPSSQVYDVHKEAWEKAENKGVMNGERPNHPLTRSEFATVANRLGLFAD